MSVRRTCVRTASLGGKCLLAQSFRISDRRRQENREATTFLAERLDHQDDKMGTAVWCRKSSYIAKYLRCKAREKSRRSRRNRHSLAARRVRYNPMRKRIPTIPLVPALPGNAMSARLPPLRQFSEAGASKTARSQAGLGTRANGNRSKRAFFSPNGIRSVMRTHLRAARQLSWHRATFAILVLARSSCRGVFSAEPICKPPRNPT